MTAIHPRPKPVDPSPSDNDLHAAAPAMYAALYNLVCGDIEKVDYNEAHKALRDANGGSDIAVSPEFLGHIRKNFYNRTRVKPIDWTQWAAAAAWLAIGIIIGYLLRGLI